MIEKVNVLGHFSDHNVLVWDLRVSAAEVVTKEKRLDFRSGNLDGIRKALRDTQWGTILTGNASDCWDTFKAVLSDLVTAFVPNRSCQPGRKKKAVWMTYRAAKCVRRKHDLYRKYKDPDSVAYKKASKAAKKEIRKAKKKFERKLAQNIKQDVKSFYTYVNSRRKVKSAAGPLVDQSGNVITEPEEMAEQFNAYFSTVFNSESEMEGVAAGDPICSHVTKLLENTEITEKKFAGSCSGSGATRQLVPTTSQLDCWAK